MNIEDLRRIYLIIVLSQFIYCVSIEYVLNKEHDFKQKKNVALIFMKDMQIRTTQIIAEVFRNIVDAIRNIEFYLLSIR
jgi:hexokinase